MLVGCTHAGQWESMVVEFLSLKEKNECKLPARWACKWKDRKVGFEGRMTGDWDPSDSKRVSSRCSNNKHGDLLLDTTMRTWTVGNPGASNPGARRFPNPESGRPRLEIRWERLG